MMKPNGDKHIIFHYFMFHLEDKRQCSPCLNSYNNTEIVRFNSELSRENARKN